jgi:hypothetical protein
MSVVTIDTVWLNQIKKVVASPMIDELLLTDEQIKDLIIFPVLQRYFTKFPIKQEYQASINGEQIIPFPDEYVFGVLDCRVVDIGLLPGSGTSFWDLVMFQATTPVGLSSKGTGAYGVKGYNPSGLLYQRDAERQKFKSQQNQYTTIKSRVDIENKQLIVYSSVTGALNITWAKYSNNFNAVMFERRNDVIKLCQAELLDQLIDAASILSDSGLEVQINTDKLSERSNKLKEEVKEDWLQIPDTIYLHAV